MPANLGTGRTTILADPRFLSGSYIHNGQEMYYVLGRGSTPSVMGTPHTTLTCEDCATGRTVELDMIAVRKTCRLVNRIPAPDRAAPLPGGWA